MRIGVCVVFLSLLFVGLKLSAAFQPSWSYGNCSGRHWSLTFKSFKNNHYEKIKDDDGETMNNESMGNDDEESESNANDLIHRQKPEDPTVKRKKRNGASYRTVDNRDNLPFVVQVVTPDPYRNSGIATNSSTEKKRKQQTFNAKKPNDNNNSMAASVVSQNSDGSAGSIIGEFALDKSTTSGDIVSIGDVNYQVQVARCQYKYAGGKRFVMVRKILEVKEITRAGAEFFLQHQFSKEMRQEDVPTLEL